jgi:hypothetical protein
MLWFFNDYAVAQYNTLAYWVYMDISGKKRPVETIPGMGVINESDGGHEFNYDRLNIL